MSFHRVYEKWYGMSILVLFSSCEAISMLSSAEKMSLSNIVAVHRANVEIIKTNFSYLYRTETHFKDKNEYEGSISLTRRKGDSFFELCKYSGHCSTRAMFDAEWGGDFMTFAFDGKRMRINALSRPFMESFLEKGGSLLDDTHAYDRLLNHDREVDKKRMMQRPGPHPTGTIEDGLGSQEPGRWLTDSYFLGTLAWTKSDPPVWYADLLGNPSAQVVETEGPLVKVSIHPAGSIERLHSRYPDLSQSDLQRAYELVVVDLTVDTSKGCMVTEEITRDKGAVSSVLQTLSLAQDPAMGAGYSTGYDLDIRFLNNSRQVRLLSGSTDEIPESTFLDVWFDEQQVLDKTTNEKYFFLRRKPSEYNEDRYRDPMGLRPEDRQDAVAAATMEEIRASSFDDLLEKRDSLPGPDIAQTVLLPAEGHLVPASGSSASSIWGCAAAIAGSGVVLIVFGTSFFLFRKRTRVHS